MISIQQELQFNQKRRKMIYVIRWRLLIRLAILLALIFGVSIFTLKFISEDEIHVEITGQCRPRQNIVFVKTHKCASSTIQNILMRYGEVHNLTFVLPSKFNYIGHPQPFQRELVPDATAFNLTYNILTHHSRFNYQELRLLMPEDTVYVTIVRNPVDLFQSMFYYNNLGKYWPTLMQPNFTFTTTDLAFLLSKRLARRIGLNQMSFDLGLDPFDFDRPDVVRKFLSFLDQTMDLVMVAEQMDQSLVLLADLLCWKLEDVVALRLNARLSDYKPRAAWPEATRRMLSSLSSADAAVYEHFTQRFRERVRDFGEDRMRQQMHELEQLTGEKMLACRVESHHGNTKIVALRRVVYYTSGKESGLDCARLVESELEYTEILRKKQQFMFPKIPF